MVPASHFTDDCHLQITYKLASSTVLSHARICVLSVPSKLAMDWSLIPCCHKNVLNRPSSKVAQCLQKFTWWFMLHALITCNQVMILCKTIWIANRLCCCLCSGRRWCFDKSQTGRQVRAARGEDHKWRGRRGKQGHQLGERERIEKLCMCVKIQGW